MSSTFKTTVYVVLGVLLVLAVALLAFLFVRRGGTGPDEPGDPDDETDDSGPQAGPDDSEGERRPSPDDDAFDDVDTPDGSEGGD